MLIPENNWHWDPPGQGLEDVFCLGVPVVLHGAIGRAIHKASSSAVLLRAQERLFGCEAVRPSCPS